jgi:hypothetical protein
MTETLQRTEQVITVAELREMLDDEDEKSFADLTSKGVAQVRGGAWRGLHLAKYARRRGD